MRVTNIGIQKRSPGPQFLQGRFFEGRPARQLSAPPSPKRTSSQHFLAVEVQPFLPLVRNPLLPARGVFGTNVVMRPDSGAQNIKVMHLAERVLQLSQVRRPLFMTLRQEVLHRVAEALDTDAQLVIARLRAVLQRLPV